jgi:5-methylcytosine-specific restriction endonuclease McrA
MVGLGLVEPPVPMGEVSSGALHLTGNGERLYTILRQVGGPFSDRRGSPDVAGVVSKLRRSGTYEDVCDILTDSPSIRNFRLYLAKNRGQEIRRTNRFYEGYGAIFGIRGAHAWTARNRVPSVVQMAQLCGIVGTHGSRITNTASVTYLPVKDRTKSRLEREIRAKAHISASDSLEDLKRFLDDGVASLPARREAIVRTIVRNLKLSSTLKDLYHGRCQICNSTFKKKDGSPYSESHHLTQLSKRGADVPGNVVVLCATCHRKLHYADVQFIPGPGKKRLVAINGKTLEVRYNARHLRFLSSSPESSDR